VASQFTAVQGPWSCPMCWWHGAWGWPMFVGGLFWVVVLVALVVLIVRVLPRLGGGAPPAGRAEEILKERYARGEIARETYERMLTDVRRSPGS
jgi:putative membrane protein